MPLLQMNNYITFPFYRNGKPLLNVNTANNASIYPTCGMTVRSAGSMRFRWNEKNPVRQKMLSAIARDFGENKTFVPVQLDHTHIVYDVSDALDTDQKIGDGIITTNQKLIPTVTVADCVPIFLYAPVKNGPDVFGIVHSGWKGTGIVSDAIKIGVEKYGALAEDFSVVIGPHIHDCCYIVNEERAQFFMDNFTEECVRPLEDGAKVDWNTGGGKLYRLSLAKANLACLKKIGVPDDNIYVHTDCTSCNDIYGSNRRETKISGRPDAFTVQAAFVSF